eukprot:NODE_3140_length_976_cov_5.019417_g2617_i0.p1 GENE.NODE_3140_length_976_cov_5.019417_g2617_i0~~NODE_3140_length_976_cov_5.019417_g2617_i0.p1  ORF type:complete len:260 (+),score=11.27 NODE_3140_length_976_cov_5.019417_g2617_i0:46-780(+)
MMVHTAPHPMGPWAPQAGPHDPGCVDAASSAATAPPASRLLGHGVCQDNDGLEPSYYVGHGTFTAPQCVGSCRGMPQCRAVSYGTGNASGGSCRLYVVTPLPAPDNSSNWVFAHRPGHAANISRVSPQPDWRCFLRTSHAAGPLAGTSTRPTEPLLHSDRLPGAQPTPGQGCMYHNAALISRTRAQQNALIELSGGRYVWTGDRWGQAPDGLKGHEGQFWGPLDFGAAGEVLPVEWVDSFELEA